MQNRRINNTFYVSVEGNTEEKYLNTLQNLINKTSKEYTVKFKIRQMKPLRFMKYVDTGLSEFPYYHVCDYDDEKDRFLKTIDSLVETKAKNGYNLAYSNICFELWIILHKKEFMSILTKKENYLQEINKTYGIQIKSWDDLKKDENLSKIFNKITLGDVKLAINNANKLMKNTSQNYTVINYKKYKYYEENPSLNIHEFVEFVLKKSGCL